MDPAGEEARTGNGKSFPGSQAAVSRVPLSPASALWDGAPPTPAQSAELVDGQMDAEATGAHAPSPSVGAVPRPPVPVSEPVLYLVVALGG